MTKTDGQKDRFKITSIFTAFTSEVKMCHLLNPKETEPNNTFFKIQKWCLLLCKTQGVLYQKGQGCRGCLK